MRGLLLPASRPQTWRGCARRLGGEAGGASPHRTVGVDRVGGREPGRDRRYRSRWSPGETKVMTGRIFGPLPVHAQETPGARQENRVLNT